MLMQTSFLRKTVVANGQNPIVSIPTEWYGAEIEIIAFPVKANETNGDKLDALGSFLDFADNHKVIESDFHFDREACYDR